MTNYPQIRQLRQTTDANSNKNLTTADYTFTSASVSVAAGSFASRSYVIPLSQATRVYQIYTNYSFRPGQFYSTSQFEYIDPVVTQRRVAMQMSSNADGSLSLVIYLVNQGPGSSTFAAFDINVRRRDFLDEL